MCTVCREGDNLGIITTADSHCEHDCGEFDNSGQVLIAQHISGNKLETPQHVQVRVEMDEGCETGGYAQSVPSISEQHNISGEIGSVTINGMASHGVMPGNTDVNPGVFIDMTRNTRLDSLAFDYVDQGTAGGGLQGQEFGSFSDRGYDQSTRGCGLQGIHVGSDTGHSTQDSVGQCKKFFGVNVKEVDPSMRFLLIRALWSVDCKGCIGCKSAVLVIKIPFRVRMDRSRSSPWLTCTGKMWDRQLV